MAFKRRRTFKRALRRSKRARIVRRHVRRGRGITRNRRSARLGQGFPKRIVMTHKYHEIVGPTSTAGVLQNYLFSCNGMFDPNFTGTGHQPMYFDQMGAIYAHYTVIGSKATFKITPSTTPTAPWYVSMFLNDDTSTVPTDVTGFAEETTGMVRQGAIGSVRPIVLRSKWSAKKFFPGSTLANFSLRGDTSTNPAEQTFYNLGFQAGGSTTLKFDVECYISYIAVWTEVRDLAQS